MRAPYIFNNKKQKQKQRERERERNNNNNFDLLFVPNIRVEKDNINA